MTPAAKSREKACVPPAGGEHPVPPTTDSPSSLPYWQIPGERPGNDPRRRWYHPERWEMERLRLRLGPGRPQPPFREPSTMSEIVLAISKKLGIGMDVNLDALREQWPALVGEDLARRCHPVSLEAGTLSIGVKGAVWMFELRRAQSRLLAAVRAVPAGRDVQRLAFRPDAGGGQP